MFVVRKTCEVYELLHSAYRVLIFDHIKASVYLLFFIIYYIICVKIIFWMRFIVVEYSSVTSNHSRIWCDVYTSCVTTLDLFIIFWQTQLIFPFMYPVIKSEIFKQIIKMSYKWTYNFFDILRGWRKLIDNYFSMPVSTF